MVKKNIAILSHCYGCGVCVPSCPKKIIDLRKNENGFYSPVIIDQSKCIECGICLDVCAFNHSGLSLKDTSPTSYAGWSNDSNVRLRCSSGGVGYELGKKCIENGMKACGVRYNAEKRIAEHFIASTVKDYMSTVGSKYIPSYTVDALRNINKRDKYLVTGTPCQIDSFRRYVRRFKIEDNFILMDFFCHGVPSLLLWDQYLEQIEKKVGRSTFASWRNKTSGWHDSWSICIDTDKQAYDWQESYNLSIKEKSHRYQSKLTDGDLFYKFFLGNLCLNDCCYDCKYKACHSSADIRIGDLWGKKYQYDDMGTSAVIALTERGLKTLQDLNNVCTLIPETLDNVIEGQMRKSPTKPWVRKIILNKLNSQKTLSSINSTIVHPYKVLLLPRRILKRIKRTFIKKR